MSDILSRRVRRLAPFLPLTLFLLAAWAFPVDAAGNPPHLTLSRAVETALANNPQLAGFPFDLRAAEARIRQASVRPNPEVSLELENIAGNLPGLSRTETTVSLSQVIETGKRGPRIRRSEAEAGILRQDYDAAKRTLASEVKTAFVSLLGAQRRLELAREAREIASLLHKTVSERVAAGAVSPIEETRAKLGLSLAAADVERAGKEVEEARRFLSGAMGESTPSFETAAGDLREDVPIPEETALLDRLRDNPELRRFEAETRRRQAVVAAEEVQKIPDMTVSGGYRFLREESLNTFVLGASVPLPVFNRNEGSIRDAREQLAKLGTERKTTEVRLASELLQRRAALAASVREAKGLRDEALSAAQGAYDAVSEGYRLGKFRYLDVLDAGKALVETKVRHAEAVLALNLALADLERLAGGPVEIDLK